MKKTATLCLCISIITVLSGCMTMHTNTQAPMLTDDAIPKLSINKAVALRNSSTNSGDIIIGKWIGWTVYGDLYKFTESSISAAKDGLKRMGVTTRNDAEKVLKLEVNNALSEQENFTFSVFPFRVTTALTVSTGDGLKKEYTGVFNYPNGYQTTWAIEKSLARCVAQMLNDSEIIQYLEE